MVEQDPIASTSRLPSSSNRDLDDADSVRTLIYRIRDRMIHTADTLELALQPGKTRSSSPDVKGKGKASIPDVGSSGAVDKADHKEQADSTAGNPTEEILFHTIPKANIVGVKYARGVVTREFPVDPELVLPEFRSPGAYF